MNYSLVDGLKEVHPVSRLCDVLDVHKSSYYYWQGHRQPTAQRVHLQVQAKAVHADTRQTYGSRRMSTALKAQGLDVGRYRARRLMQEAGLVAVRPKNAMCIRLGKYPVSLTIILIANSMPSGLIKNGW